MVIIGLTIIEDERFTLLLEAAGRAYGLARSARSARATLPGVERSIVAGSGRSGVVVCFECCKTRLESIGLVFEKLIVPRLSC